jgi:hypothetical protein
MEVPIPYLLFSITKIAGNFHKYAMLIACVCICGNFDIMYILYSYIYIISKIAGNFNKYAMFIACEYIYIISVHIYLDILYVYILMLYTYYINVDTYILARARAHTHTHTKIAGNLHKCTFLIACHVYIFIIHVLYMHTYIYICIYMCTTSKTWPWFEAPSPKSENDTAFEDASPRTRPFKLKKKSRTSHEK